MDVVYHYPKKNLNIDKSGNENVNVGVDKIDGNYVSDEQSLFDIAV